MQGNDAEDMIGQLLGQFSNNGVRQLQGFLDSMYVTLQIGMDWIETERIRAN